MPQRAILNESINIQAHEADEDNWSGLIAAYFAGALLLPCCGNKAIPKENRHGTRYFSHGPYKRQDCDWKRISSRHEGLVAEIASVVGKSNWDVTTEVKDIGLNIDLLCSHLNLDLKVAIMIELSPRETILDDEAVFLQHDFPCIWMLSEKNAMLPFNPWCKIELEHGFKNNHSSRILLCQLEHIERAFLISEEASAALADSSWLYEINYERGIPSQIDLRDSLHGVSTRLEIDGDTNQLSFSSQSFSALSINDRKRCASLFEGRLQRGIELWWPNYPNLDEKTFRPLEEAFTSESKKSKSSSFFDTPPLKRRYERTPSVPNQRNTEIDQERWQNFRIRDLHRTVAKALAPEEIDNWIDTPNDELSGLTPKEVVMSSSDGVRLCEVALGLRDPLTNKPIK